MPVFRCLYVLFFVCDNGTQVSGGATDIRKVSYAVFWMRDMVGTTLPQGDSKVRVLVLMHQTKPDDFHFH